MLLFFRRRKVPLIRKVGNLFTLHKLPSIITLVMKFPVTTLVEIVLRNEILLLYISRTDEVLSIPPFFWIFIHCLIFLFRI